MTYAYIVIARAADKVLDGSCVQVKLAFNNVPGDGDVDTALAMAKQAYREGFGREADRTAVVVLPWTKDDEEEE